MLRPCNGLRIKCDRCAHTFSAKQTSSQKEPTVQAVIPAPFIAIRVSGEMPRRAFDVHFDRITYGGIVFNSIAMCFEFEVLRRLQPKLSTHSAVG